MTPEEARENLLTWIKSLLQNDYNILEIKKLQLSDFELMIEALEQESPEKKAEETEITLDKAFPFLFG